jgi:quinol monooxygenase YgiN
MATPHLNASIMAPRRIPEAKAPGKQLTLFVTLQVLPENAERFKEVHRPLWKRCSEEEECLLFDVFQDLQTPGRFRFFEVWSRDRYWFEKVRG